MIYLPIIFFALSGLCKSIQDTVVHHFDISVFSDLKEQWWNADLSWENKYKYSNKILAWLFKNPLVMLTDAWHLFGFLHVILYGLGACFITWYYLPLYHILYASVFHIFYTKIWIK